jgi:hypothetical protein
MKIILRGRTFHIYVMFTHIDIGVSKVNANVNYSHNASINQYIIYAECTHGLLSYSLSFVIVCGDKLPTCLFQNLQKMCIPAPIDNGKL